MVLRMIVGILLFLLIAPILVLIPLSFSTNASFSFPPDGFSMQWYEGMVDDSQWMDGFKNSILVASFTAIVAMIIGTMAALAVHRLEFPGKKIFVNIMVAPMVIPVVIVGISMYHSFSLYKLTNSLLGLVLAHSILAIPIVYVTVFARLKGVDRNLELAAMSLGSRPIGAFFKVTLPLIRPAVVAGCLFAFITSLDEVVVSIFISGSSTKTLPVLMWEMMRTQVDPTIAAVSSVLIVGTILFFLLQSGVTKLTQKYR